jgi:chaperone BCS1
LDKKRNPATVVGLSLGIGEFKFMYHGEEIIAIHTEVGLPVSSFHGDPVTRRDLTITVASESALKSKGRGLETLQRFVADVYLGSISKAKKGTFKIYRWNAECEYWSVEKTVTARPLESVIMDPTSKKKLLTDMDDFLGKEAKDFYLKHGIPYRRSYLLHGKPGSGKTSLIQALAGHYGRSVCFLQPTNPKITDDNFKQAMNELPEKSIVVLEDIDTLFQKDRSKGGGDSSLTFSGLLNALDGVGSADGRLVFMTTNFRNRLDSALIRPGRVDLHVNFPWATKYQMEEYFRQYYPNGSGDDDSAAEFATRLMADLEKECIDGIATASLQHFFVTHRKLNPNEALASVGDICEEVKLRLYEEAHVQQIENSEADTIQDEKKSEE